METLSALVRTADRDRYSATLYAPESKRSALMALYAFNVEIARIRDITKEPMAGEMRLQWWRDALTGGTSTETAGHPVAGVLTDAIRDYGLPIQTFENMTDARRFDLYNDAMPSRNDLEGYCGETAGALIQLSSLILDAEAAAKFGAAAGHAGCAQAIAGLLSLLPVHIARGQCYIPSDLLSASGLSAEQMLDDDSGGKRQPAVMAMIALGRDHLAQFWKLAGDLPAALRPAYLPVAGVPSWFNALERAGDRVLREPVKPSPLRQSAAAFRRAIFGWR